MAEAESKKIKVGWFSFSCCEDSTVMFTELLNDHYKEWLPLLDIRHARVQTIGDEVVDTFYVRGADGGKVVDPADQQRIVADIRAALARDATEGRK